MMIFRKLISYILSWCLCTTLAAQTSRLDRPDRYHSVDSLEQVLVSGKMSVWDKSDLLIELSRIYRINDTVKSRTYATEALILAQKNGLKNMEAAAYCTLGGHYLASGMYYIAHVNFKKAEKLFSETDNQNWLSIVNQSLMVFARNIEDYENMKYYAEKVLEKAVERNDRTTEILARYFLGLANYHDNEGEEALNYYLDLLEKSSPIVNRYVLYIMWACGDLYVKMDRPREALHYLHSIRENVEDNSDMEAAICANIAQAYAMLHRTDSAEYYLKKLMDQPFKSEAARLRLYDTRSMLYANKGDYRSALENFEKYHHLSDSIAKAGKTTEMARLKNWRELEQKDNENEILQQEHQKQHRLILILAGTLFLIFALLALSVFLFRKTSEKNRELKQLHTVKDKLFSVVAHDLRSPMGSLISMLNLANENELDAETQAQLLGDISARVDDTYGLLDNLLHWSKSQMQGMTPAPVVFDAREGSLAITDNLQSIATHKNIILNNRIEKQQVYADRDMFAVVVRNLTMNAIKYTPEVGKIILASELKDNMLIISVKDNGTGMTQEVQDKLFKLSETRSKRGTNNESGTGLGLVLCADFVKINGGNIWFTSKQGEGSTFYFSIPLFLASLRA